MVSEEDILTETEINRLFPVFLKLEGLQLLIVGGGNVAIEKLNAVLNNSPRTNIKMVGAIVAEEIKKLSALYSNIEIHEREFYVGDLDNCDVVITAVNDSALSEFIYKIAKQKGKLINSADKPEWCDFYLGSVVSKGNLKVAISTNGKSPTVAKRLREIFSDALPPEMDDVLNNLGIIRGTLNGTFHEKVKRLEEITNVLVVEPNLPPKAEKKWRRTATYFLFAFFFMFFGHLTLSYIPFDHVITTIVSSVTSLKTEFYWMILAGFLAQLVDGALGMGYGVTSTTILLSIGVNLPAISGSVHTAEMFSSGLSGYSHYRFGNVNKKLFKTLLIPGVLGAIAGAYLLSKLGTEYANYVRPVLAVYTLLLGVKIIRNVFRKNAESSKVKRVGWLAGAGGFLDSFGGGGWGPLVTSTLISKGKSPRYVIGSVSITEFFVTLASAATFFALLGVSHWPVILGLIVGGTLAAPLAAKLVGKLPIKAMFLSVGALVIIWSLRILIKSIF